MVKKNYQGRKCSQKSKWKNIDTISDWFITDNSKANYHKESYLYIQTTSQRKWPVSTGMSWPTYCCSWRQGSSAAPPSRGGEGLFWSSPVFSQNCLVELILVKDSSILNLSITVQLDALGGRIGWSCDWSPWPDCWSCRCRAELLCTYPKSQGKDGFSLSLVRWLISPTRFSPRSWRRGPTPVQNPPHT